MLAKKRGGIRDKSRKMAKKGAPAALQTDVTNDEDWAKILERKGLVLADIYSEWSGPCVGMINILKKIKMEIGGDNLSYATARCDNIESLARFRGQSEPTWMFIRDGKMVNILFGASGPRLIETLTDELKKLEAGQTSKYCLPVSEMCDEEIKRKKEYEQKLIDKYAEENEKRDAEKKAKYEAELGHYLEALQKETCLILLPWLFKDEEGNKRDKKSTPAYVELVEQLLPEHFKIDREVMMQLDEDQLKEMQKEMRFEFSKQTKQLFLEDKSLCIMLRVIDKSPETDIESCLFELLYSEPNVPQVLDDLVDECFVQRNLPPSEMLREFAKDTMSIQSDPEKLEKIMCVTTAWTPINPRNKVMAFRALFPKYIQQNCQYEDKDAKPLITVFKYDHTKMRELLEVHEMYRGEVLKSAIFERDKVPDPKKICRTIEEFEELHLPKEQRNNAVFVWVVRKSTVNVFLSFAGIGPTYVSETDEIAEKDAEQFFPRESTTSSKEIEEIEEEKAADEQQADQQQEQQPQEQSEPPAPPEAT